ncbi:hypothetical protein MKZ38_001448 [Zalerion maritima]|uniref:Uncharacterized protein n=1 Tax=Zalerion maritima TaxID=339359 RepID=A0AAD5S5F1_9PEZI|nr:hypothetical protein MKZ38_001448 [Zalerion maritima]
MAQGKEGNETPSPVGQSKRSHQSQPSAQDSDSQQSDQTSTHTSFHTTHHPRIKSQKHIVGGNTGRLHARVPSSKALHKHGKEAAAVAPAVPAAHQPKRPQIQRRVTAEARPSRDNSSVDLRKNISQTTLKRNSKSHVELSKKSHHTPQPGKLRRSESHTNVPKHKHKSSKSQVHFDLGKNEEEEEEWVDASGSASPYLSRRTSVASGPTAPPSAHQSAQSSPRPKTTTTTTTPATPTTPTKEGYKKGTKNPTSESSGPVQEEHAREPDPATSHHNKYLTTRVLQRIPSHGAVPPQMSSETVQVPMRPRSPDRQGISRQSSTLSGTPRTNNTLPGSTREDELSSRFINSSTSAVNEGSFYTSTDGGGGSREGRRTNGNANGPRRPLSVGSFAHGRRGDISPVDDDERERAREGGISQPSRRGPTEVSRTQQKLNLQRASSTLEPSPAHGGGIGGPSPLIVGAGDPRAGKMLERTGMEYLVVRRYQNPVARSIARLSQLPGVERSRRIPPPTRTGTASSRMSGPLGLGQSFRQPSNLHSRPVTPRMGGGPRQNGSKPDSSFENPEEELSGASLVENSDDNTTALLRSMWDRRMDFASASQ